VRNRHHVGCRVAVGRRPLHLICEPLEALGVRDAGWCA
jgi:hypothetical protein